MYKIFGLKKENIIFYSKVSFRMTYCECCFLYNDFRFDVRDNNITARYENFCFKGSIGSSSWKIGLTPKERECFLLKNKGEIVYCASPNNKISFNLRDNNILQDKITDNTSKTDENEMAIKSKAQYYIEKYFSVYNQFHDKEFFLKELKWMVQCYFFTINKSKKIEKLFHSYLIFENRKKIFDKKFTVNSIQQKYPELCKEVSKREIAEILAYEKNSEWNAFNRFNVDLDFYNIDYAFNEVMDNILGELRQKNRNIKTDIIKKMYSFNFVSKKYNDYILKMSNKNDVLHELNVFLNYNSFDSHESIHLGIIDFFDRYAKFDNECVEFKNTFGSMIKIIDLPPEKESIFKSFDINKVGAFSEWLNEYKYVFLPIWPQFINFFYEKNECKFKRIYKDILLYSRYVEELFKELLDKNILSNNNGVFEFNNVEEITKLKNKLEVQEYLKNNRKEKSVPFFNEVYSAEELSLLKNLEYELLNDENFLKIKSKQKRLEYLKNKVKDNQSIMRILHIYIQGGNVCCGGKVAENFLDSLSKTLS